MVLLSNISDSNDGKGLMLNKTTKNNSFSKFSFGDLKNVERFGKHKIPEI
jgi:hypothetical protein